MPSRDIYTIWDLHGSFEAYWWNMREIWIVENIIADPIWKWGDSVLIFLWDILADRNMESIKIINSINILRKSAHIYWWEVHYLAWNHEDIWLSYFTEKSLPGWWNYMLYMTYCPWVYEFKWLWTTGKEKIENLKNIEEYKTVFEEILNMKLIHRIDDILFTHTLLNNGMIDLIAKYGVDNLNNMYMKYLKHLFLVESVENEEFKKYIEISDTFLSSWNRHYWGTIAFSKLKQLWINLCIHGHNSWKWAISTLSWVNNIDCDFHYWKTIFKLATNERSVVIIKKSWEVYVGGRDKRVEL